MAADRVIHEIERNEREILRAVLSTYKGNVYAHLRIHFHDDNDGLWKPTKAGIAISVERFHELEEAVKKLREAIDADIPRPTRKAPATEKGDFRERYRNTLGNKGAAEPTPLGEVGA